MSTLISRDPFAREELHRERVYDEQYCACAWCGGKRTTPAGRSYLYRYRLESDDGRVSAISRDFCSVGCMRDYHS